MNMQIQITTWQATAHPEPFDDRYSCDGHTNFECELTALDVPVRFHTSWSGGYGGRANPDAGCTVEITDALIGGLIMSRPLLAAMFGEAAVAAAEDNLAEEQE